MIWMRRRASRSSSGAKVVRSRPSNTTEPLVGRSSCRMQRPVVVFPHPDSPTSPSVSPRVSAKLTPATARTRPRVLLKSPVETSNSLTRSVTSRMGASAGDGMDVGELLRLPARAHVPTVADLAQRWTLGETPVDAECAARDEGAALGKPAQIGRLALDGRQTGSAG